ncbi:MAG: hypothetical protein JWM04_614 [Verrucomicrobiales bacterium]|nr:hypothetical protein [Verrucomicrobiales bacterium]
MKIINRLNLFKNGVFGFALALGVASNLHADTTVFFVGGNASQTVLYDRTTSILTGSSVLISPTNTTVRTYTGTIASQPGLGTVTIHYALLGAVSGFQDAANQNSVVTATGVSLAPTVAVSSTSPEAVAVDPAPFVQTRTLVVPFAFIKNPAKSPNLAGVTNLTQRQAAYLEGASGFLPASFFGGTGSTPIYLVARNTAAAVRTEIDLNIYFSGTISSWTTNSSGQPIPDTGGGQANGAGVKALLNVIPNAIGTVAAQDIGTFTTLSYEGVPYSVANVENGSYPIWGFERWAYLKPGQTGAPSANQLAVINALLSAVTNASYQNTSSVFVGNFVPLSGLQVDRSSDGGPIFLP